MEYYEYNNEIPLNTLKSWRDNILSTAKFEFSGWTGNPREPYRHWAYYPEFDGVYKEIFECLNESIKEDGFDLIPHSILLNSYNHGDSSWFHRDMELKNNGWTILLFLNDYWDINWHGHLIILDEDRTSILKAVLPIPGRYVLFKNHQLHSASPVSREAQFPRLTLAIQCINSSKTLIQ